MKGQRLRNGPASELCKITHAKSHDDSGEYSHDQDNKVVRLARRGMRFRVLETIARIVDVCEGKPGADDRTRIVFAIILFDSLTTTYTV